MAAALSACPGPGEDELSVVVGTGCDAFEMVEGELLMVPGPQGGHHVWASVLADNLGEGRPTTQLRVADADGRSLSGALQLRLSYDEVSMTEHELIGVQVIMASPERDEGKDVTLEVQLTDGTGATATGSAAGRLRLGDTDVCGAPIREAGPLDAGDGGDDLDGSPDIDGGEELDGGEEPDSATDANTDASDGGSEDADVPDSD